MVEFISELASALDRIILLKPFEIRSSHQATECDEDDDDDDSELLAQQQRAQAQATATMMNLNELKCAPLFLPNGEINTADQRSPVKEELPPRPSNQFVGAVASTIATTEVEDHLRGRNADIEDHLNVVNEKMEQLKVQEEEEESLLLFDHEMHQVRFLLSDFPFAFDANLDCQGPHLISMSICHHFQNCSEQISIISQSVEMSFAKQNEWVGHDSGMCGRLGHNFFCRMIHKKTQKV
jgi:hypothetical protein